MARSTWPARLATSSAGAAITLPTANQKQPIAVATPSQTRVTRKTRVTYCRAGSAESMTCRSRPSAAAAAAGSGWAGLSSACRTSMIALSISR